MRKSNFTEAEIASAAEQVGLGSPAVEVWRKPRICSGMFCPWKRRFGGMEPREIKRLKEVSFRQACMTERSAGTTLAC